jgi:hypothetical protein
MCPNISVADPGCLSRIPDPRSKNSNRREGLKKKLLSYLYYDYHKIENYLIFELARKNLGQFTKNYRTSYPKKTVIKHSKI